MKTLTLKNGRNVITVPGPFRISTRRCQRGIRITGGAPADLCFRDGTGQFMGELGPRLSRVFDFGECTIAIVGREGDVIEYDDDGGQFSRTV